MVEMDTFRPGLRRRSGIARRPDPAAAALAAGAFLATSVAIAIVEGPFGVRDASWLYLIAVVAAGWALGTSGALVAAVVAFVTYDFLFTAPRLTLIVADPHEWIELLLFLFVGAVVGTLVGLARSRARTARDRAAEAESLVRISRVLATRPLADALPVVAGHLRDDLHLQRVWIELEGLDSIVGADTGGTSPRPAPTLVHTLARDDSSRWIASRPPGAVPRTGPKAPILRVAIRSGDSTLGVVEATAGEDLLGAPAAARQLALAADIVALAAERDRLESASVEAEVARRSDALKSRLIASVSHDLRTPLAAIRAAAGTVLDDTEPSEAARQAAATIEAEADRLDRMVRGLLDLGRIDAGTLRPTLEACDLGALVETALERIGGLLGDRPTTVDIPDELPPVLVDEALFDHVLGNLLENVARHAPPPAALRISASDTGTGIRLVVEDGGPGLSAGRARQLFGPGTGTGTATAAGTGGFGIGLSVVRGLAAAMSIELSSGPSELGGLAVGLDIRPAARPPGEAAA